MKNFDKLKGFLYILMCISTVIMFFSDTDIWILLAAFFTYAFFIIWIHDNIRAFSKWKKDNGEKLKDDFQIFKEYEDEFTKAFCKEKSEKWR